MNAVRQVSRFAWDRPDVPTRRVTNRLAVDVRQRDGFDLVSAACRTSPHTCRRQALLDVVLGF
jgi:hypothetical protein